MKKALLAGVGLSLLAASPALSQTITVWDWKSGDPVAMSYFDQAKAEFEEANPDVTINYVMQPNDQYYTILGTALASGAGPDVFLLNGGAQARARFEALTDLTDLSGDLVGLEEFQDEDGTVYALPISIQGFVVYYNKALYEQAGLDPETPPQTWDDLVAACEVVAEAGSAPCFTLGNREGFAGEFILSSLAASMLTEEQQQAFADGELAWSSPEVTAILETWVSTQDMGWYREGANSTSKFMDEYEQFMRGDAVHTIGLMSDIAHWKQFDDFLGAENVGVFRHPAPDMAFDEPRMPVSGGIGYGVNKDGDNVELATAFVEHLASAGPIQTFVNDAGVVPANTTVDTSGLSSPSVISILDWLEPYGVTTAHANVTAAELTEWQRQSQLLLNGDVTPAEAAARLDEVQAEARSDD
ncbi:ABC transporter substrate-binding protein [Pelagibacterium montanilacus]|uniref:ABC transporter substrate-binding protein n=1 Tax=Pelagibacterium montanilacus TaxID=2185280 RepID=UPI000F8C8491|nr:extracellular solute-binding protein [Pelagibacterium montanilacus]